MIPRIRIHFEVKVPFLLPELSPLKFDLRSIICALVISLGSLQPSYAQSSRPTAAPFPALIPSTLPTDRAISAAMRRLYTQWNPLQDEDNELYSNFKYSALTGLGDDGKISRRDPSKIIKIDGVYFVWYTRRATAVGPGGPLKATATVPSFDWDLADIYYATSMDGFHWEEVGVAVKRAAKPGYGWRSVTTPDILVFENKFYLYYQAFNQIPGLDGDRADVTVAEADSPHGPWRKAGRSIVGFGAPDEWDAAAIHDPNPIVFQNKIHLYYKGSPSMRDNPRAIVRAQGVATAEHPLGPFVKSELNPVINSGHETCVFPFEEGVAAIVSLDGPEKNTVQYAADGLNFEIKSIIQIPPLAPGPFVFDAFSSSGDGQGITWGLSHTNPEGTGAMMRSALIRFDCDLSLQTNRPAFKHNNLRFDKASYFQSNTTLTASMKKLVQSKGTTPIPPTATESSSVVKTKAFPAIMPEVKPKDRPLSAAWSRMWDRWNPHEDRGNELYSNFKYSHLTGLKRSVNISRRDPTKVIRVNGVYYVWYTHRETAYEPVGLRNATDTVPGTDWDMADIYYATSKDGFNWTEQGAAVKRPAAPMTGFRSICTPDILMFKDKFYLYFQAYSPMVGGQVNCPVMVAWATSPDGPWTLHEEPVIEPGPDGAWDNIKINDPYLLVYNDQIHMYYKGAPIERGEQYVLRMQGLARASDPLGPFVKSALNPVLNSGHETCLFPFKDGVAALVALDGPEKNTIQYAADGENFEFVSMIQLPPIAPGPFVPDAFDSKGDGRGITWGLAHINPDGGGATSNSILVRFDCDLSLDADRGIFKRNNLRFEQHTYLQDGVELNENLRKLVTREQKKLDKNTITTHRGSP